jgi:hypothetical protein
VAFDPRLILIGILIGAAVVWAWRRLFRHPQYADQPEWTRWAYLAVMVALFVMVAFLWTAMPS